MPLRRSWHVDPKRRHTCQVPRSSSAVFGRTNSAHEWGENVCEPTKGEGTLPKGALKCGLECLRLPTNYFPRGSVATWNRVNPDAMLLDKQERLGPESAAGAPEQVPAATQASYVPPSNSGSGFQRRSRTADAATHRAGAPDNCCRRFGLRAATIPTARSAREDGSGTGDV
jgi:hypothetical protein